MIAVTASDCQPDQKQIAQLLHSKPARGSG